MNIITSMIGLHHHIDMVTMSEACSISIRLWDLEPTSSTYTNQSRQQPHPCTQSPVVIIDTRIELRYPILVQIEMILKLASIEYVDPLYILDAALEVEKSEICSLGNWVRLRSK